MYTIVRKDCLCLAAGFLQIYVQSLPDLTVRMYLILLYIYPMSWRSISPYPLSIVQHTPRFARIQCFGDFLLLTVFFQLYYGFMSELKILFDDKAVYIYALVA